MEPLKIVVTLRGAQATEMRRVCQNLDITPSLLARKAILAELKRMGVIVE